MTFRRRCINLETILAMAHCEHCGVELMEIMVILAHLTTCDHEVRTVCNVFS